MYSIGICDDDQNQLNQLETFLLEYARERSLDFNIKTFTNAFLFLDQVDFNLCFLDIFMPTLTGMDVAKELRKTSQQTEVIFCTSSADFALASYEVQENNYLVKPLKKGKLFACLDLLFEKLEETTEKTIPVSTVDGFQVISRNQICLVYVEHKICTLKLMNGNVLYTTNTFKEFTNKLLEYPEFALASRAVLLNFNGITGKKGSIFTMKTGDEISASKRKNGELTTAFLDYQEKKDL